MPPKILVVDDEADAVSLLELILTQAGYEVVKAYSGKSCLEAVAQEIPSLIILDIIMPDMSGLDVLKTIKDIYGTYDTPPVIFFTAKSRLEDRIEGLEAGAFKYLTKPTQRAQLLEAVAAALVKSKT